MAFAASQPPATSKSFAVLSKPFVALGKLLVSIGEANSRSQTLQRLMAQSDAELARRGLKRSDLGRHAFSDSYYL